MSRIRSALQSGFSRLSFRISACIGSEIGGRPSLPRDLHRQYRRKAVLCHFFTVAGCIRWAQACQFFKNPDRMTHRRRKPAVNRGRGNGLANPCAFSQAHVASTG